MRALRERIVGKAPVADKIAVIAEERRRDKALRPLLARDIEDRAGYYIDGVCRCFQFSASFPYVRKYQPGIGGFTRMFQRGAFKGYPVWRSGQERDHTFATDDFLWFVEDRWRACLDGLSEDVLASYAEGRAYNYTPMEAIGMAFDHYGSGTDDQAEGPKIDVGVLGFRVVRAGEALHMMAVMKVIGDSAGTPADLMRAVGIEAAAEDLMLAYCVTLRSDGMAVDEAFGVFHEHEPTILVGYAAGGEDDWLTRSAETKSAVKKLAELIEPLPILAVKLAHVGLYYGFRVEQITQERSRPADAEDGAGAAARRGREGGRERAERKFRVVSALRVKPPESAKQAGTKRSYSEPEFAVEVEGYWRPLRPNSIGKGPHGEPVLGRTFVAGYERYKNKPVRPKSVLVKQPVRPYVAGGGDGTALHQ